jgi:hypothetical protein
MLNMTIVNVALPSIQQELDVPPTNLEGSSTPTRWCWPRILVGSVLGPMPVMISSAKWRSPPRPTATSPAPTKASSWKR